MSHNKMSQLIQSLFASEETSEQEKQSILRLLQTIVILVLVTVVAAAISEGIFSGRTYILIALLPVTLLLLISLYLVRRGVLWPARFLIPITIFGVLTYLIVVGRGIHDVSMIAYAAVLILSSLMLGQNAALVFGVFVIIAVAIVAALEINGVIVNESSFLTAWDEAVLISILVLAIAGLLRLMLGRLTESLRRARESEQAQIEANRALRELQVGLEEYVEERTRELKRRSSYLLASAEVGRAATSILERDSLIQQVVELIREQFDLYYVGLFLVDEAGQGSQTGDDGAQHAVLKAGTGEAGQAMLARGHRLRVGYGSMVGWCIAHAEPRVALEASEDAVRRAMPELPDTRSEAALPLRSRGQVLGALTVQHTEPGAFDQDTIVVLQTMADQVAVALENARLFAEREQALETAQRAYGDLSRQAWREMLQTQSRLAYRSDEHGIADAGDVWRPEMERVLQTGRTVRGGRGEAAEGQRTLTVPIKVRGEIVGVLDTYKPAEAGDWTAEEIALLESIAEQLDPALESARLYQDTQRRAAREQTIRQVTERMRRAVDVEAILQNTVTELARAMGAPRAYVRLGTETELRSSRAQHVGEETGVDPEPQPPHGQGSFLRNEGLSTLQSEGEDVDA